MVQKYCVATCHRGTDFGVFQSGPDDEQLTLEDAENLANSHDSGYYLFDCTINEYYQVIDYTFPGD